MRNVDAVGPDHALTILIVDDDADMRYLARMVLQNSGMTVAAEAADGSEAIERLRELGPPPDPTVVLLDNQMPGQSGLEVARQILAERPGQLIVLFSAFLNEDIITQAADVGVAKCISKADAINLATILPDVVAARR